MKRILAAVVIVSSFSAFAQQEENVVREPDKTTYAKETKVDFTPTDIEGTVTKPEGDVLLVRKRPDFKSLLKVRDSFKQELRDSADAL